MASKYLSGTYTAGYTLSAAYTAVTLGGTGSIGGTGLVGNASYDTVANLGRIAATTTGASGIALLSSGTIVNGSSGGTAAFVGGAVGYDGSSFGASPGGPGGTGISLSGSGTIVNWGTIFGGAGGQGLYSASGAVAGGGIGGTGITLAGSGDISNMGLVAGGAGGGGATDARGANGGAGIVLSSGISIGNSGTVAGGSGAGATGVNIHGVVGGTGGAGIVLTIGGTVGNSGTIAGGSGGYDGVFQHDTGGSGGSGITGTGSGTVTNTGLIVGGIGGGANSDGYGGGGGDAVISVATVANTGTIAAGANGSHASAAYSSSGVGIDGASLVSNGSVDSTSALIVGRTGIDAAATVINFGSIVGTGYPFTHDGFYSGFIGDAVVGVTAMTNAGTVASLHGGAIVMHNEGTLDNSGLITATGIGTASYAFAAVVLEKDGTAINSGIIQSKNNTGIYLDYVSGSVTNLSGGTISGGSAGVRVGFTAGIGTFAVSGTISNKGLIIGNVGVAIAASDPAANTIINYGTIASLSGSGGTAVSFGGTSSSLLVVEGGSTLIGTAVVSGGTLAFAGGGGAGIASGLGSHYSGFAQIDVLSAAQWSLSGTNAVGSGMTLSDSGTLVNTGTLTVSSGGVAIVAAGGLAVGVTVAGGGSETVSSGGVGQAGRVALGGFLTVLSGGTESNLGIAGGTAELSSGAVLSGTVDFHSVKGGVLQIDDTAMPGNTMSGLVTGDAFDLRNIAFDSTGSAALVAGNVLRVNEGGVSHDLNLDPAQDFTNHAFELSSDGNGGTLVTVEGAFQPAQLVLTNFAPGAGGWTSQDLFPRVLGDVNGDGRGDIVGFGQQGVWVALASGGGFASPSLVLGDFGVSAGGWSSDDTYPRTLGDVNGDGSADIVGFGQDGVLVALANGTGGFGSASLVLDNFAAGAGGWSSENTYPRAVGDVNGDGKADIVGFGRDGVWEALATSSGGFASPSLVLSNFAVSAGGWSDQNTYPRFLADVTGDGRDDIVGFGQDGVWVSLANADGSFTAPKLVLSNFAVSAGGWTTEDQYPRLLADVNGDGKADIVGFGQDGVWVSLSNGGGTFAPATFDFNDFGFSTSAGGWTSQNTDPRAAAPVTGGGGADLVGFGFSGVFLAAATVKVS